MAWLFAVGPDSLSTAFDVALCSIHLYPFRQLNPTKTFFNIVATCLNVGRQTRQLIVSNTSTIELQQSSLCQSINAIVQ